MNLALDPAQEQLRVALRTWLAERCSPAGARSVNVAELWPALAARGWLGFGIPAELGGSGGGLTELAVVASELGRVADPFPLQTCIAQSALALAELGDLRQRALLRDVLSGTLRLSFAPAAAGLARAPVARASAGGFVLRGRTSFVPHAEGAHGFLVVARLAEQDTPVLLRVDAAARGVTLEPQQTFGFDAPCAVQLDDVRVPDQDLVGGTNSGETLDRVMLRATALLCAEMAGGTRAALDFAVEYAKHREQFGRPIGSFQAVQHRAADMLMSTDAAELAAFEAVSRIDAGVSFHLEVHLAKITCNEAYLRVTASAQQILGGVGFYADVDAGAWYQHARTCAAALGGTSYHAERAAALLDL